MDYLFSNYDSELLCGVDEAGRGPLAGPVVAAAVILDPNNPIEGLKDSKKLTAKKREELAPIIRERALAWAIAEGSVAEIDQLNILEATMRTMVRAVEQLQIEPTLVLIDGNRLPKLKVRCEPVVHGDDLIPAISAASILAKTYWDSMMKIMAEMYPKYGFEKHFGYGTEYHLKMLSQWGPCPIHRMTFAPVAEVARRIQRREDRKKRKSTK